VRPPGPRPRLVQSDGGKVESSWRRRPRFAAVAADAAAAAAAAVAQRRPTSRPGSHRLVGSLEVSNWQIMSKKKKVHFSLYFTILVLNIVKTILKLKLRCFRKYTRQSKRQEEFISSEQISLEYIFAPRRRFTYKNTFPHYKRRSSQPRRDRNRDQPSKGLSTRLRFRLRFYVRIGVRFAAKGVPQVVF
jgi:hypothetical protein